MNPIDLKSEATLIARGALGGVVIVRSTDDTGRPVWIATTQWAWTKQFGSLAELGRWLDRVGGDES